ncbi:MAG TPA: hypothetical protein VIO38_01585, partial [Rariglobus sp.]
MAKPSLLPVARRPRSSPLDRKFPRYEEFDPLVPVWCVTPDRGGCIHRFFDTSPISPSGRYLAVFRLPFEDRQPRPGEPGQVCLVDLKTGAETVVAETCGWEPQLGANLNWGGSDHELFFNDVNTSTWTPFAWKLDPLTGVRRKLGGTVYHASPDGRWLISANLTTLRRTQAGYGVRLPEERAHRNIGAVADDGFYLTDTHSGRCRLFVSLQEIFRRAGGGLGVGTPDSFEIYGFHCKFNPQGDRLMLSIRWFPTTPESRWEVFKSAYDDIRFAWITVGLDGSDLRCAVGPEQWAKGGHHATWFPDGRRLSMNLAIDRGPMRFVGVNADGTGLAKLDARLVGSGHPTVHPDGRHLLTDAYTNERFAFGDGTVPLRWID